MSWYRCTASYPHKSPGYKVAEVRQMNSDRDVITLENEWWSEIAEKITPEEAADFKRKNSKESPIFTP